jgi:hypothetical protein
MIFKPLLPIQDRGPVPKGIKVISLVFFPSSINLSGLNEWGFG